MVCNSARTDSASPTSKLTSLVKAGATPAFVLALGSPQVIN
jgi:hypothetical protein